MGGQRLLTWEYSVDPEFSADGQFSLLYPLCSRINFCVFRNDHVFRSFLKTYFVMKCAMRSTEATYVLKRELRKHIRSSLAVLLQSDIEAESRLVTNQFLTSTVYQNARSIALYASMPKEFDTTFLLRKAFQDSKQVFLPRVVSKKEHKMIMLECASEQEIGSWTPNSWDIREPPLEDGRLQTPLDVAVDLVIVPGVAFDIYGARCGQGMGFYDRFLSQYSACFPTMPRLVSLALSVQIVDSVPVTSHDWKVDDVIFRKSDTI